jgi:hypothetical protein
MTSEIIIFQPPEEKDIFLSKSERELLYEDLEKYSPLNSHHFNAFYDMETAEIESNIIDSTIVSIMFKYVANYCYPIIREIPKLNLRVNKRNFKKVAEIEDKSRDYYFMMQFSQKTNGFTKLGFRVVLTPNVHYQVIGIKIPKVLQLIKNQTIPDLMNAINIFNLTTMGSYGLQNYNTKKNIQQNANFVKMSFKTTLLGKTIIFTSNDQSLEIVKEIINVVNNMDNYYKTYYSSVYTSLKYRPFSEFREILNEKSIKPDSFKSMVIPKMEETSETKKIREIYNGVLSSYYQRFQHSLYNNEIFNIFNKIKLLGLGNSRSTEILDELVTKNTNENLLKLQKKQKYIAYLEFAKKQAISFDKFQIRNLHELNKSQREIMELTYLNLKKLEEGSEKMSESLKIVGNLYESIENMDLIEIKKNLAKIKSLAEKIPETLEKQNLLIKDINGTSMVCPHILIKAQKILDSDKDIIKLAQVREYVLTYFSLPDISLGHFCRVCGGLLATQDEEKIVQFLDGQRVNFTPGIDRRQALIWKEVAHMITTFVKFKDAVNLKKIINSITMAIKGEIGEIETKLSKIKTNNNDNIQDMLRVYIAIYTYAILIHMIYLNYGKITFISKDIYRGGNEINSEKLEVIGIDDCENSTESDLESDLESESQFVINKRSHSGGNAPFKKKKNVKKVEKKMLIGEDKKRLQNIFRTAIEMIIKSKNAVLNKLSNISIDNIKPLLIKAYQWVVSLKQTINTKDIIRQNNTAYFLSIDPVYEYIWYAHSLKSFSEKKGKISITDVKRYLGRSIGDIEKDYDLGKTIYETAQSVTPWGNTQKAQYDYGSFMYVFEYTSRKLYNYDIIPQHEAIKSFIQRYSYLDKLSDSINQNTILKLLSPFISYEVLHNQDLVRKNNDFSPSKINIADHYCSDGTHHLFNIFVFTKILQTGVLNSNDNIEVTSKEVAKWYSSNDSEKIKKFKNYFYVDEKCSKCQVYLSKTKKDETLIDKMKIIDKYKAFYDYFETRCPEGNLHDFKIDAKKDIENCNKCGFTRKLLINLDKSYYNKYIKNYNEILENQQKFDQTAIKEFKNLSKTYVVEFKKYPNWIVNNNPILSLSRKTLIKYNILVNLGLSEGRKFENIEKEKENPHINSSKSEDIVRNQYLRDYCLWVLRMYYIMRNYNIVYNIPRELKEIIDKHRSTNLGKIKDELPDIYEDFNEKYTYYFRKLVPKILANFLLNYLCSILVNIMESLQNTKLANLGIEFVNFAISSIITSEKDVSKPPPLSLIINKGSTNGEDLVAGDEYYDASDDDPDDGKDYEDLGDVSEEDDFSRHNMDIDMSDEDIDGNAYDQ